ncbi:hypothetical protein C804_05606 [Lachnospiraceae bacterium A4]|nr:hypothetical protein C804_05606 [Lachnospiraceae bacterium A4]
MGGKTRCKEILGKDFSKPDDLASIRREGLVKKLCPHVLQVSIEIIEDMLRQCEEEGGYVRLDAAALAETEKIQTVLRSVGRQNRLRKMDLSRWPDGNAAKNEWLHTADG